eukprot:g8750.t1 g8750   contig34:21830-23530(-)
MKAAAPLAFLSAIQLSGATVHVEPQSELSSPSRRLGQPHRHNSIHEPFQIVQRHNDAAQPRHRQRRAQSISICGTNSTHAISNYCSSSSSTNDAPLSPSEAFLAANSQLQLSFECPSDGSACPDYVNAVDNVTVGMSCFVLPGHVNCDDGAPTSTVAVAVEAASTTTTGATTASTSSTTSTQSRFCGPDALSAYLACDANTACSSTEECSTGELCFSGIACPVDVQMQLVDTMNVNTTNVVIDENNTTATEATTSGTSNSSTNTAISINTNSTTFNSQLNITSDQWTTYDPNSTRISWTTFPYATHLKYCGPKVVGGYAIAVQQCSPITACGFEGNVENHYGSSGNDCPKNFMCYSFEGRCGNGPGAELVGFDEGVGVTISSSSTVAAMTTEAPIVATESSATATQATAAIQSQSTTTSSVTTPSTQQEQQPQNNILDNTITTRGSFCGSFYAEAVSQCSSRTMCDSSRDCGGSGEECFPNISCTMGGSGANDDAVNGLGGTDTATDTTNTIGSTDDLYTVEFSPRQDDMVDFLKEETSNSASTSSTSMLQCFLFGVGVVALIFGV